jgi:hypothetical protein
MMTIKIIQHNGTGVTKLFAGHDPSYFRIPFANKKEFIDYTEKFQGKTGIGMLLKVPEDDPSFSESSTDKTKSESSQGELVHLTYYDETYAPVNLIITDAEIYIMQDGRTVDTIYV